MIDLDHRQPTCPLMAPRQLSRFHTASVLLLDRQLLLHLSSKRCRELAIGREDAEKCFGIAAQNTECPSQLSNMNINCQTEVSDVSIGDSFGKMCCFSDRLIEYD